MRDIVSETLESLERRQDLALIKVIADSGSTPRAAGAEMVLRRDGTIAGTIGGGLLEATMMRVGQQALAERRSFVTSLALTGVNVDSSAKMICGGTADVLVAYVPPADAELIQICRAIKEAISARRRAWLFTELGEEDGVVVTRRLLDEDGCLVGSETHDRTTLLALADGVSQHQLSVLSHERRVVIERIEAPPLVVICGGGHVGLALAPAAAAVGFAVVVLDDREEFADPARFPGASVVSTSFHDALSHVVVDQQTYIVVATRSHTYDKLVLEQALNTPARYVGLMASKTKRQRLLAALREQGFTHDDLARIHSPIGLEIRAETPPELAISVVAELILVRAGGRLA